LHRRASQQFIRSGHNQEGARSIDAALLNLGIALPRGRLSSLALGTAHRLRHAFRGLAAAPSARELDANAADALELLWLLCLTESRVDHSRSSAASAVYLTEALRLGDVRHTLRAMTVEATTLSALPVGFAQRTTDALMERAAEIVKEIDDPHWSTGYQLALGCIAFFRGDLLGAEAHLDRCRQIYRKLGTPASLELAMVEGFRMPTLAFLGRMHALAEQTQAVLDDAELRQDRFLVLNVMARHVCLARLAEDRPEAASAYASRMLETAPSTYSSQHYDHVAAMTEIDLYTGDAAGAWQRLEEHWPKLRANQFLMIGFLRDDLLYLRGRAALALAATRPSARQSRELLRVAHQMAVTLDRNGLRVGRGWSAMLRAGVAALEGNDAQATAELEPAIAELHEGGCALHAAAAKVALAERVAEPRARTLRADAERVFEREAIRNVKSWMGLLAPALRRRS
jgi:hypothetical protein